MSMQQGLVPTMILGTMLMLCSKCSLLIAVEEWLFLAANFSQSCLPWLGLKWEWWYLYLPSLDHFHNFSN